MVAFPVPARTALRNVYRGVDLLNVHVRGEQAVLAQREGGKRMIESGNAGWG